MYLWQKTNGVKAKKGAHGSFTNERVIEKREKKERVCRQSAGNAMRTRNFATNEKWIENIVKHRVFYAIYACIYYISNDIPCDLTSFQGRVIFFLFRFFLFWKSLHFVLTWPLRSYDITFTCTLSVASMETWACVSIVSSSRARASRTYRSVSMNKRTKTRRCQK